MTACPKGVGRRKLQDRRYDGFDHRGVEYLGEGRNVKEIRRSAEKVNRTRIVAFLEVRVEEYRLHLQREGVIVQGEMIVVGVHGNALAIVTAIPEVLEKACQRNRKTFKRGDVAVMVDYLERAPVEGNAMIIEAEGTVDFIRNKKLSNKTILLSSVILPVLVEGQSRNRTVNCEVLDLSQRLNGLDVIRLHVNDLDILRERENELFPSHLD